MRGKRRGTRPGGSAKPIPALTVIGVVATFGAGCTAGERGASVDELMSADSAFAHATAERGADGWVSYFAEDGIMVVPGRQLVGRDEIRGVMTDVFSDPGYSLLWSPTGGEVAGSGDLGYTIGRYLSRRTGGDGADRVNRGTYVTVWRLGASGDWKVAVDLGVPDPEAEGAPAVGSSSAAAPEPRDPGELRSVAFMSGCWRGSLGGGGRIEESYTPADAGLMLGMTRFIRDGRAQRFEFSRVRADSGGITLIPYPGGEESDPFPMVRAGAGEALFENPSHDFPKRISYRRIAGDTLVARIEGDGRSREWRMSAISCGAGLV